MLSGCSNLPVVDYLLATPARKEQLLQQRVELFNRALYWGTVNEILAFVEPDYRSAFLRQVRQNMTNQKLVDLSVVDAALDGSGDATVDLQVRYYEQNYYLVKTRMEHQTWAYHRLLDGWLLKKIEIKEPSEKNAGPSHGNGPLNAAGVGSAK